MMQLVARGLQNEAKKEPFSKFEYNKNVILGKEVI